MHAEAVVLVPVLGDQVPGLLHEFDKPVFVREIVVNVEQLDVHVKLGHSVRGLEQLVHHDSDFLEIVLGSWMMRIRDVVHLGSWRSSESSPDSFLRLEGSRLDISFICGSWIQHSSLSPPFPGVALHVQLHHAGLVMGEAAALVHHGLHQQDEEEAGADEDLGDGVVVAVREGAVVGGGHSEVGGTGQRLALGPAGCRRSAQFNCISLSARQYIF